MFDGVGFTVWVQFSRLYGFKHQLFCSLKANKGGSSGEPKQLDVRIRVDGYDLTYFFEAFDGNVLFFVWGGVEHLADSKV